MILWLYLTKFTINPGPDLDLIWLACVLDGSCSRKTVEYPCPRYTQTVIWVTTAANQFNIAVVCIGWVAVFLWPTPRSGLWAVWSASFSNSRSCLQLSQSYCLGCRPGMDRGGLCNRLWRYVAWIWLSQCTIFGFFAGMVNKLLSLPILYPFSRVTYCAYLVHPLLIRCMVMTMDSPVHLGRVSTVIIFLGQVLASYIISFVLSITFEAPVVSMLRIISKVVIHKRHTSSNL